MTYEDIFSRFLSKVQDNSLLNLSQDDAYIIMKDYLDNGLSKVYIRKLFETITLNDETYQINYTLTNSVSDFDEPFVIDILAQSMVVAWMQQKVDTDLNLAMIIGGKEEKVLKNDYKSSVDRLNRVELNLKKMIRDHGYQYGSYEEG